MKQKHIVNLSDDKNDSVVSSAQTASEDEVCSAAKSKFNKNKLTIFLISIMASVAVLLILLFTVIIPAIKRNEKIEIKTLSVFFDENAIGSEITEEYNLDHHKFDVVINDGKILSERIKIKWAMVNDLGCTLDNDGNFAIGESIGKLHIKITVESLNVLEQEIFVNIVKPQGYELQDIDAISPSEGLNYTEGQKFFPNGLKVLANFKNGEESLQLYVADYSYDKELVLTPTLSQTEIKYTSGTVERFATVYVNVQPKKLQSIEFSKFPTTTFIEGQPFDKSEIEITAHYEYVDEIVNDYTLSISDGQILTPQRTVITATFQLGDEIKSVSMPISVKKRELQDLIIDTMPNKLMYVQGQKFATDGMKIKAKYEYIEQDVTQDVVLSIDRGLLTSDKVVVATYTENGKTLSVDIEIEVKKPYEQVRKIVFENSLDASLSWMFEYYTDEGQEQIDNTTVSKNEKLLFDNANGIYIVPVGARVTLSRVNPLINSFIIDGVEHQLIYPASTYDFDVDFGEEIFIEFGKTSNDKFIVRFAGNENEQNWAFVYPLNWNSPMKAEDLIKLGQIYEDNAEYCYQYDLAGVKYSYSQLATLNINQNTQFYVEKVAVKSANIINFNVVYDDSVVSVVMDKIDFASLAQLPQFEREGYSLGFSTEKNGSLLNDSQFADWLNSAQNGDVLYAVYNLTAAPQEGPIVGSWHKEIVMTKTISLDINFNADGTYVYISKLDGQEKCRFEGIYEFKENQVNILSVRGEKSGYVTLQDFDITLNNNILNATLILIEENNVGLKQVDLTKI